VKRKTRVLGAAGAAAFAAVVGLGGVAQAADGTGPGAGTDGTRITGPDDTPWGPLAGVDGHHDGGAAPDGTRVTGTPAGTRVTAVPDGHHEGGAAPDGTRVTATPAGDHEGS